MRDGKEAGYAPPHSTSDRDFPGMWIGVIQEELFTAVATAVSVMPCVVTMGHFVRAKTKGIPMETAPCCGVSVIRSKRVVDGSDQKKILPVFVPFAVGRTPTKRPFSRLTPDPITAILYLPSLLLSHVSKLNMIPTVTRCIISSSVDISLHVDDLLARLQSFCDPDKRPLYLSSDSFPILQHIPLSLVTLMLQGSDKISNEFIERCVTALYEEHSRRSQLLALACEKLGLPIETDADEVAALTSSIKLVKCLKQYLADEDPTDAIKRQKTDTLESATVASEAAQVTEMILHKCLTDVIASDNHETCSPVKLSDKAAAFGDHIITCLSPEAVSHLRTHHCLSALNSDLRLLQPKEGDIVQSPITETNMNRLPSGLIYIDDFVSEDDEEMLIKSVSPSLGEGHPGMLRRVAHFGYKYRYPASGIDVDNPIESPEWMEGLARKVEAAIDCKKGLLSQLTANEYQPGQGIAPHFDCFETIGEPLCTLSLGCDAAMSFVNVSTNMSVEILLKRRSIAILTGDARYHWLHAIPKRKTDASQTKGKPIARGKRLSLTLRNVPPVVEWKSPLAVNAT